MQIKFSLEIMIFCVLLLISNTVFGQIQKAENLYGSWVVESVEQNPTEPSFKSLMEGFKTAKFMFNSNRKFELSSAISSGMFGLLLQGVKDTNWKLDEKVGLVKIGTEKDKFSKLDIIVSREGENTFFYFKKAGIKLQMKKNQ